MDGSVVLSSFVKEGFGLSFDVEEGVFTLFGGFLFYRGGF